MEANTINTTRQFVTFKLEQKEYGIDIQNVSIIEKVLPVTRVPKTPGFIKGVVNLRGEIIPIMDLRMRFNLPEAEPTEETRVIILKVDEFVFGIVVDSVAEVLNLSANTIESTANLGNSSNVEFIQGVGKVDDRIVILLNLERLVKINS
ncbi:MAG: chemotaxis protein CheW [Bacillota bacterium]|nr:chemotaxis protein CheW [Bacillota bacterium]